MCGMGSHILELAGAGENPQMGSLSGGRQQRAEQVMKG